MVPHAPLLAGSNSSLSNRYDPAIISYNVGDENRLLQPQLTLPQKSPKSTPCLGHSSAGMKRPALYPSSTNFLKGPK